jgi:hypothetical protein
VTALQQQQSPQAPPTCHLKQPHTLQQQQSPQAPPEGHQVESIVVVAANKRLSHHTAPQESRKGVAHARCPLTTPGRQQCTQRPTAAAAAGTAAAIAASCRCCCCCCLCVFQVSHQEVEQHGPGKREGVVEQLREGQQTIIR